MLKSWASSQCKSSWLRWWLTFDLIDWQMALVSFESYWLTENLSSADLGHGRTLSKFRIVEVNLACLPTLMLISRTFKCHSILTLPLSLKSGFLGRSAFVSRTRSYLQVSFSNLQFRCHSFGAACASSGSSCTMLVSFTDIDGLLGISHDCCSKNGCCSEIQTIDSEEEALCCGTHSSSIHCSSAWDPCEYWSHLGPEVPFGEEFPPDVPSDSLWLSAVGILAEADCC